jgi:hypothetical protein
MKVLYASSLSRNVQKVLYDAGRSWIPVDVSFVKEFWLPDAEILNLKEFKTLDVLSKLVSML